MVSLLNNEQSKFWLYGMAGMVCTLMCGYLIAALGIAGAGVAVVLPIACFVLIGVFAEPRIGLLLYLQLNFLIGVAARFLTIDLPFGVFIDASLILTMLSLLVNAKRYDWGRLHHPVFYLVALWVFFTILEFFNPEAPYKPAWLYNFRKFSLYWILATCIVLVVPFKKSDIKILIRTWLFWSFLGALWGFKQQYIGLTANEQNWLDMGGSKTHVLFGVLRIFSFYTDASQFGAEMAATTLVCIIWFFEEKKWIYKIGYLALALVYFWGYALSGTRSALFVLVGGYAFYLLLRKDIQKMMIGAAVALPIFIILMYTNIGSGNYQVQRMRTALRPMEDPSFILRLQNKEKLARLMENYPFGAGLGTSEAVGQRFSPNHWASQIAPDSWYVILWIETGSVGMTLYVIILVSIIAFATWKVWQIKDPWLFKIMVTMLAELGGIAIMAYSNPVMGQFPTSGVIFISMAMLSTCHRWDTTTVVSVHKIDAVSV
ncbi:O-antigen ligase family protein [Runella aurantiaca]|uniref:O-antigen ligase domain-containing protein n=1 Tax=Runella aurantiaca TaxID=2282308 RepID=A0A369IIU6_9BACT|nr:O-antigen ligase family protein [Runella aurantiaca]RDB06566.1 O-antigen ligase domain-containing protein [Runella aurantiaca]